MKPPKKQIGLWLICCFLNLATALTQEVKASSSTVFQTISGSIAVVENSGDDLPEPNTAGYGDSFHFTEITLLVLIASVILLSVVILLTRKNFDEELKRFSDSDTGS